MVQPSQSTSVPVLTSTWRRHVFYRKESVRTTWKSRLAILVLLVLGTVAMRGFWGRRISESLTCTPQLSRSDVILVENSAPNYLLFERAAALHKAGLGARVLIPVHVSHWSDKVDTVSIAIAQLMAQEAQLQKPEIVPILVKEPISLNMAYWLRDFLTREHFMSVVVVTPGFRSRRSSLVYQRVLAPAGITVSCVPVFLGAAPDNWSYTWHGIQEVGEQFLKLQFYRFYVLLRPIRVNHGTGHDPVPIISSRRFQNRITFDAS